MTYERPLGRSEADFVRNRIQILTLACEARELAVPPQPAVLTNLSAHNYIQELAGLLHGGPPTVIREGTPQPVVEQPEKKPEKKPDGDS